MLLEANAWMLKLSWYVGVCWRLKLEICVLQLLFGGARASGPGAVYMALRRNLDQASFFTCYGFGCGKRYREVIGVAESMFRSFLHH